MRRSAYNRRVETIRAQAHVLVEAIGELEQDARDYYDERSEKWQDSDKGAAFDDFLSDVESAQDEIATAIDSLPEYPE